ncbi:ATP-binding protein [Thaumasiovibrio subtropicus]|uniref:ATP-binding protein n=1 Tax=Thaumasiovibrio subtropicus TaxID=1891207 RepID=UPI000B3624F1|nr:ATP-binding protein [Thaumasiovibrio subtropicus]
MNPFVILCLTRDPVLRARLQAELGFLDGYFDIQFTAANDSGKDKIHTLHKNRQKIALLICDDSGENLIDFLVYLEQVNRCQQAGTILISDNINVNGLVQAINAGKLSYVLSNPWQEMELRQSLVKELTRYVLLQPQCDWLSFSEVLDRRKIHKAHIDRQMSQYRSGFVTDPHNLNDALLAEQVIEALYDFFNENDETQACRTYSEGHILTREGEPNHHLWFIAKGEVALYKDDKQGEQHEVIRHQSGSLIGGMSFVSGDPSFSTGVTLCQTQVIKLDRELFNKVINSRSDLLPLFTNLLLRHFNRRIKNSIRTEMRLQQTIKELEVASEQLVEKEKMAMLGQLVAGVAHELNNPVAAILRGSETLQETIPYVTDSSLDRTNQQRGNEILTIAMTSRPISTQETRKRAREVEPLVGDRNLAKKLVKLGLDEEPRRSDWIEPQKNHINDIVNEWEHYYQVGSFLRSISVCAKRIADMVKSLKSYARQDEERTQVGDIHEGIEDTLIIFENRLKHHVVTKEYADLPLLRCRPIALQQVWTNLIANALDAMPPKGEIKVVTRQEIKQGQPYAVIEIHDSGSGIEPELLNKIFELNFTTKREGNFGLGIGLSVCQQIVREHGGLISMSSVINEGTTASVSLPIHHEENTHE